MTTQVDLYRKLRQASMPPAQRDMKVGEGDLGRRVTVEEGEEGNEGKSD